MIVLIDVYCHSDLCVIRSTFYFVVNITSLGKASAPLLLLCMITFLGHRSD